MTNNQFIDLLYSDLQGYLLILALIAVTYYVFFGRNIKHIADPLMIGYIAQVFSCSVVLFLFYKEKIYDGYFYSFIYTEIMFIFPLILMRRNYVRLSPDINTRFIAYKSWNNGYSVFYYSSLVLLLSTSLIYFSKVGVPIFNQISRLDSNESVGILSWFTDIYWICFPAMVIIKRFIYRRRSIIDYLMILFCFLCLLGKGGKADFFFLVVTLFMVKEVYQIRELNRIVKILSYLSPFIILGLMVIIFSVWGARSNVLNSFFERFVLFGDVFYQGYNKNFIEFLPKDIGLMDYFFGGTMNKIRGLFGIPLKEKVIFGYEISKYYYNIDSGIGPNARQNILGLYLLGPYLSGFFSLSLGIVYLNIRSSRWLINKKTSVSSLKIVFYIMFCTYSSFIFVDPALAFGFYLKILTVFSIPLFLSLFNARFFKRLSSIRTR